MRPLIVLWLNRHGLPGWLTPNYFVLAGFSSLIACWAVLRLCERDRDDVGAEARTLLVAYLGALLGGYVLEILRSIPAAIVAGSVRPLLQSGRAAYGGLLLGALGAALYRLRIHKPLGPFFDRVAPCLGLIYFAVRGGCFLAGCDYGVPTALPIGVRYPPGSLAALEHAVRGWVPAGAPSLPTHPTQLYEGAVALVASLAALFVFRRGARDGSAFLTWLALYGVGRFGIEFLRGDATRGFLGGWSSAQYISFGLLVLVGLVGVLRLRRLRPHLQDERQGDAAP